MESKSFLSFKVFFQLDGQTGSNIRRFRMDCRPTYEQFVEFMHKLYTPLYHPELRIQYVDSEGDKIFVTSQIEWEEMLEEIGKENMIKLNVVEGVKPYYKDGPKPVLIRSYDASTTSVNTPAATIKPETFRDLPLEDRVTECLKQLFPGNNIIPTNIPSVLSSAVRLINVSGCDADIDVDVGQLSDTLFRYGYDLLNQNQYEKGRDIYCALLTLNPTHPTATYNMACAESLLGNVDSALDYLQSAVRLGYGNVQHLLNDSDFDAIRNHPRFIEIVRQLQQSQTPPTQTTTTPQEPVFVFPPPTQPEPVLVPEPVLPVVVPTPIQPTSEPVKLPTQPEPDVVLPPTQPEPVVVLPPTQPEPVVVLPPTQPEPVVVPEPVLPVVVPEDITPAPVHQKWGSELALLHDIGYHDDHLLIMLLDQTKGDIQRTVLELLEIF